LRPPFLCPSPAINDAADDARFDRVTECGKYHVWQVGKWNLIVAELKIFQKSKTAVRSRTGFLDWIFMEILHIKPVRDIPLDDAR